jgi:mono/diheme cytochrome c family protein
VKKPKSAKLVWAFLFHPWIFLLHLLSSNSPKLKDMRYIIMSLLLIAVTIACGSSEGGTGKTAATKSEAPAAPDGAKLFKTYCVQCHGLYGDMQVNGAKDLTKSEMNLEDRITIIENGKNLMTPFKGMLSKEQIEAVAKYTMELKK